MIAPHISDEKFEAEIRKIARADRRPIAEVFRVVARLGLRTMAKEKMTFVEAANLVEPLAEGQHR